MGELRTPSPANDLPRHWIDGEGDVFDQILPALRAFQDTLPDFPEEWKVQLDD